MIRTPSLFGLQRILSRITGTGTLVFGGALTADRTKSFQNTTGTIAELEADRFSYRNIFINGRFTFAQRGTSFTAAGYTLDRWLLSFGATAPTLTQQTRTLGTLTGSGKFFLRLVNVAGTTTPTLSQRIEAVDIASGRQITLSLNGKITTSTRSVTVDVIQNFGTGGAPSAAVTTAAGAFSLTTTLARTSATITVPSISGKTLGTNGDDYLEVRLNFPTATAETYDLYDFQCEIGSVATSIEEPSLQAELSMCQRYYWKTFPLTTAPAQNAGLFNYTLAYIGQLGGAGTFYGNPMNFPVTMRATPTVTFFNPAAANNKWRNFSVPADSGTPSLPLGASPVNLIIANPQQATDVAGNTFGVHLTAEAEL